MSTQLPEKFQKTVLTYPALGHDQDGVPFHDIMVKIERDVADMAAPLIERLKLRVLGGMDIIKIHAKQTTTEVFGTIVAVWPVLEFTSAAAGNIAVQHNGAYEGEAIFLGHKARHPRLPEPLVV